MVFKIMRSKGFWALVLPFAILGATYAGEGCQHGAKAQAKADGDVPSHCLLIKGITKEAKLTDNGAVVTLLGKNEKAVGHIKSHLAVHEKGEGCEGCPLSQEGVSTEVQLTDTGGILTVTASDAEMVKSVKEWANKPAGGCCAKANKAKKA
jgi:hypothetical protein